MSHYNEDGTSTNLLDASASEHENILKRPREEEEELFANKNTRVEKTNDDNDKENDGDDGMEEEVEEEVESKSNDDDNETSTVNGEDVKSLVTFISPGDMHSGRPLCDSCNYLVAYARFVDKFGFPIAECYDCASTMNGGADVDLTVDNNFTQAIRELSTTQQNLIVQPQGYSDYYNASVPIDGVGPYTLLPGAASALIRITGYDLSGRMSEFASNDTVIQLPPNATRYDEGDILLNCLRTEMHRYKKKAAWQGRLGIDYEGLNAEGAVESIVTKFMSVVSKIEFRHFTDTTIIDDFAWNMLAIWRGYDLQNEALDSDEFGSIDETLQLTILKFWREE